MLLVRILVSTPYSLFTRMGDIAVRGHSNILLFNHYPIMWFHDFTG